jgi:hypothetical protein
MKRAQQARWCEPKHECLVETGSTSMTFENKPFEIKLIGMLEFVSPQHSVPAGNVYLLQVARVSSHVVILAFLDNRRWFMVGWDFII